MTSYFVSHPLNPLSCRVVWIVTLLLAGTALAQTTTITTSSPPHLPACTLQCQNGGTCQFVSTNVAVLSRQAQQGNPVQTCACPEGWGGTACELAQASWRAVGFGSNDNNEPFDYCAVHDRVSVLAGVLCRGPVTDYCGIGGQLQVWQQAASSDNNNNNDTNNNNTAIPFCTNGGKCKSSYLAAQASPGNSSANVAMRYAGCACSSAFRGEHCEILQYETVWQTLVQQQAQARRQQRITLASSVCSVFVLVMLLVSSVYYIWRRQRLISHPRVSPFVWTDLGTGDNDASHQLSFREQIMESHCYNADDDDDDNNDDDDDDTFHQSPLDSTIVTLYDNNWHSNTCHYNESLLFPAHMTNDSAPDVPWLDENIHDSDCLAKSSARRRKHVMPTTSVVVDNVDDDDDDTATTSNTCLARTQSGQHFNSNSAAQKSMQLRIV